MKIKSASLEILMKIKTTNVLLLIMVMAGEGHTFPQKKGLQYCKTKSCVCLFVKIQNVHVTFHTNVQTTEFPSHPL